MKPKNPLANIKKGDIVEPEIIGERYKNSARYQTTAQKKKILCIVVSEPDHIREIVAKDALGQDIIKEQNFATPRVIAKPVKIKYGQKYFHANGKKYWIIYDLLKDFGKHFLYLTVEDNAVGGIGFDSHKEYAPANQVDMMLDDGNIELFKKNKLKALQRILLFVGVGMAIAMIAIMILVQYTIGQNNAMTKLSVDKANLTTENCLLKYTAGTIPPIITKDVKGNDIINNPCYPLPVVGAKK